MDKEVDPAVLGIINEKRLMGEKRTPVDIIARMGVFEAREKAGDLAWIATGDNLNVIATLWAELVNVSAGGRWFYVESLNPQIRIGGGDRSALQAQRAKDRHGLLKRAYDADRGVRVVLQTNRVPVLEMESDKTAKVSVRVPDDDEWHIADWNADQQIAVLVRGARGWTPSDSEMKAARSRAAIPEPAPEADALAGPASPEELHAAAMEHLTKHFAGYGYKAENVTAQGLGYDIEVSDKKGKTLLKIAVKGVKSGAPGFQLTSAERACAKAGDPWRLAVVSDAPGPAAQHKLFRGSEVDSAPGLQP
ncbi:protein NO VEIN domain-containing protein [Variovorax sp. Sphag1AA]|uniref:protein NO VEIN domain-containing protein n=1 Tax=Variovorax sp. Sphag1AA TaxID=2587027 RepID=UPI0016071BD6|nr:DUF3883 domain-containing protein [Variovorax sp. Sphag1AA]MBB3178706.1 hypothetical protein [Variovorax sp. Sphag1AA]